MRLKCTLSGIVIKETTKGNLAVCKIDFNKSFINVDEDAGLGYRAFDEVCLREDDTQKYTYFKSSKLLEKHGYVCMCISFDRDAETLKIVLLKYNEVKERYNTETYGVENCPQEILREFFIIGETDRDKITREMRIRVEYECMQTLYKLTEGKGKKL